MAKHRGGKKNAKNNPKQRNIPKPAERNNTAPVVETAAPEPAASVAEPEVSAAPAIALVSELHLVATPEPAASVAEPEVSAAPAIALVSELHLVATPEPEAVPVVEEPYPVVGRAAVDCSSEKLPQSGCAPETLLVSERALAHNAPEADAPAPEGAPAATPPAAKHAHKAKAKLPSWLVASAPEAPHTSAPEDITTEDSVAAQTHAEPVSVAASGTVEATAPDNSAASSAPKMPEVDDTMLLGAPTVAQDDAAVDALLAPTQVPVAPAKQTEHPLASIVGGFTAPLANDNSESAQTDTKATVRSSAASPAKIKDEVEHLNSIINAVESLDYLKPRMKKIALGGCDMGDLVGLYRMVSQVLLDNMRTQINTMRQMRERYEKKLRQIVVEKSAEFVKMVAEGKRPTASEVHSAEPAEGNFMLRKQLEIKEELLLKAREAQADAEARYEKITNDVANIRQRQEKDLAIRLQKAQESLFNSILPTLDSLDSALLGADSYVDAAAVVEGLKNIQSQLLGACLSEGLKPIQAKGEKFDPNYHEAMGSVTTNEVPEDTVMVELRRGYTLHDKLLRAAMVQISRPE